MDHPIRVQTQLKSRYPVFDASGHLPFDLVFGLRRKTDSEPHDISFQTTHSILDVPYALAKGLLGIHELRRPASGPKCPEEHVEVNLSALRDAIADNDSAIPEHILLPSKSNRTAKRGQRGVTEYRYRIEAGLPLAACLEVGKRYSIGRVERDLGVHSWIDGSSSNPTLPSDKVPTTTTTTTTMTQTPPAAENTKDITCIEKTCNLRSGPHGGFAVFRVIKNLAWPPTLETRMQLLFSPGPGRPIASTMNDQQNPNREDNTNLDLDRPILRITVTNPHPTAPISIQTLGQQRFLSPWGPFLPESEDGLNAGKRPTILAPSSPSAGTANFQIMNLGSGAVVRNSPKPGACAGLRIGRPDLRPQLEDLVVLEPGVGVRREIELEALVKGLEDGRYVVRLKPKGCWWCFGEVGEGESEDGEKVPKHIYGAAKYQTPAVLRSEDEVDFILKDGRVVRG